ncbi:ABC transporter permease [Candidatus Formimonas warabiya]|uniref:Diguanylate cyclase n=1 Tax=Formimonas warabiya TaxID=1761012 RepID=A0A3G1KSZ1_FORW1|nr:ABC transporter permease [Candidatus Formimonas warabiya]ATW25546.1 diguanylate cyclase [Candidatus Formimonas warabiya]
MEQLSPDLFRPIGPDAAQGEMMARPSITYGQDAWRRLKENKLAMTGLILMGILLVFALTGPWFTPFSYSDQLLALKNKPPGYHFYVKLQRDGTGTSHVVDYSPQPIAPERGFQVEARTYWFGSDALGRDLFTRNWYGARISLTIGIVTALLVFLIGTVYGGISGLAGGWVDEIMMRIVEILSAVPFLLYVILLMVLMEPGLKTIFIALGAVYWPPMARLVRGQILALKEQEYVTAARALGAGNWRILCRHLIPNTLGPIVVYATLSVPDAIFTEAWLSFLGLGVSAPIASWGALANEGIQGMRSYPWQLFFPATFISVTMLAFNVFGDGLRDALDPRLRK